MREFRPYGSVRGARSDARPYRDRDEEKLGPAAIARRLGIGRASVYRVLGTHKHAA